MKAPNQQSKERPSLKSIDGRLAVLENEYPRSERFSKVLAAVSIVVALIGAFTSVLAYLLQKDAFDANVEPIVSASILTKGSPTGCSFLLVNDGVNPVHDIRIRMCTTTIELVQKRLLSQRWSRHNWNYRDHLEPRDSVIYRIDPAELSRVLREAKIQARWVPADTVSLVPVIMFYTSYRRMPDKKVYRLRTPLYIFENAIDSTAIPTPEDDMFAKRLAVFGPMIDSAFSGQIR